jgi:hypothetical protein
MVKLPEKLWRAIAVAAGSSANFFENCGFEFAVEILRVFLKTVDTSAMLVLRRVCATYRSH